MSPGPGGGGSGVPSPASASLIVPSGGGKGGSGVPSNVRDFFFDDVARFFGDLAAPDFCPPPPPRLAAVFFRAGALRRRVDFFAADFLRADFFAAVFLRVVRLAAVFLRLDDFAADFRRVDFFAPPRRAAPLRVAFLRPLFRAAIGVTPRLKIYFLATARSPLNTASRSLKCDASLDSPNFRAASNLS